MFGTPSKQCANGTAVIATDDALGITELAAIDVNSLPQQNALFYFGGYVCKEYLAKHICKECTSSLTCSELSDLSDSSTTFLQQKSYNILSSGKTVLAIPGSALVLFLKKCEDVFCVPLHGHNAYVKGMSKAGQYHSGWCWSHMSSCWRMSRQLHSCSKFVCENASVLRCQILQHFARRTSS